MELLKALRTLCCEDIKEVPAPLMELYTHNKTTLKKLQEELLKNKNEQVKLIDKKLYYAKNAREKKKQNIKSIDFMKINKFYTTKLKLMKI
mgnify:CR=1 FL=1